MEQQPPNPSPKVNKKKLARYAGYVLMVLALIFIAIKIAQYDIDFSLLTSPVIVICLLGLAVVWGFSVYAASFNYCWMLNKLTGKFVGKPLAVNTYCKSNLYKYLPGNVMHFVGLNQLAIDVDKLTHPEVAFVTVTDNLFLLIAALIISVVSVFDFFTAYLSQIVIPGYIFLIIAAVLVAFVVVLVIFRKKIGGWLKRYTQIVKGMRPLTVIRILLFCIGRLLLMALTYLATLYLFGETITPALVPQILGLFVLSWLIGYITPGAPGGLGVREAIMLMFLGDVVSQTLLITATIIHRVLCILGDVVAFLFGLWYSRVKNRRDSASAMEQ